MALTAGTRLGPYEILAPLGAGGMGEVYRARDERLKREVAIKVLPASFSSDPDRLRRFEQEAQAAGGLNHPNITAVFDLGTHEGAPYIVQELLEGESLRAVLAAGRLPPRRAIDFATQIARGLAAAHEKGIVHRDLKPENVFVTRDGRVKILDFGLAKLRPDDVAAPATNVPTAAAPDTEPGVVLGTLGYMSPEQVRGKTADARSDIFSFGAILYEMLSGSRPFRGDSTADTMSAILREDPPDLSLTNQSISPALERIVRHCLEKNPEQRFHSAHDVAFALEAISGVSAPSGMTAAPGMAARRGRWLRIAAAVAALAVLLAAAYLAGPRKPAAEPPSFRQITFRRGQIYSARFAPDGNTIVYAASWEGAPVVMYQARPGIPEPTRIEIPEAEDVEAITSAGEMLVRRRIARDAELARVPMTGGAPRAIAEGVAAADVSGDGRSIALARWAGGEVHLEYPIGKPIYKTSGEVTSPRISPDGEYVAFFDHPLVGDDRASLAIVDRAGKKTTLTREWSSASGVEWISSGREILFAAVEHGSNLSVFAISPSGRNERRILSGPGRLILRDVAPDGRLLIEKRSSRRALICRPAGEPRERDLSWLDYSTPVAISRDGSLLLLSEIGEGGGPGHGVFVRRTDGSPAVRLGEGHPMAFTPDEKGVVTMLTGPEPRLVTLSIGAGQPRIHPDFGVRLRGGAWLADGRRMWIVGARPGGPLRSFLTGPDGGPLTEVGPESSSMPPMISPDGKLIFVVGGDDRAHLYPIDGGSPPLPVEAYRPGDWPAGWSADSRFLYFTASERDVRLYRVDRETGRREPWLHVAPPDSSGLGGDVFAVVAADGRSYAYSYLRSLSELFIVEGVK